jgi:hypothetical protein
MLSKLHVILSRCKTYTAPSSLWGSFANTGWQAIKGRTYFNSIPLCGMHGYRCLQNSIQHLTVRIVESISLLISGLIAYTSIAEEYENAPTKRRSESSRVSNNKRKERKRREEATAPRILRPGQDFQCPYCTRRFNRGGLLDHLYVWCFILLLSLTLCIGSTQVSIRTRYLLMTRRTADCDNLRWSLMWTLWLPYIHTCALLDRHSLAENLIF